MKTEVLIYICNFLQAIGGGIVLLTLLLRWNFPKNIAVFVGISGFANIVVYYLSNGTNYFSLIGAIGLLFMAFFYKKQ